MVLAMETGTGIEFYENCTFAELERHIATFNAITDKRIAQMKRDAKRKENNEHKGVIRKG